MFLVALLIIPTLPVSAEELPISTIDDAGTSNADYEQDDSTDIE